MEEQGNENQEYPRQEVPRWQNQEPSMNIPSFSPPENEYGVPQQRGGKFGSIGTIVITVIISLVLCYAMVSLLGISPSMKQYKADITRLELDLVDVRAVDTAINAELDGLQNASIIAQNASTTATQAKELVTTLQTNYASLNNSLEALQARATALENNPGDIYDDTIIRGLITAVEEDITAINTTITALQAYDTTNTTNLTALQTQIDDLAEDLADIQGDAGDSSSILSLQTEINAIKKFLNDADTVVGSLKYQLAIITSDIANLTAKDVYLESLINVNATAKIKTFNPSTTTTDAQMEIDTVAGDYSIVITLYGTNLKNLVESDFRIFSEVPLNKTIAYYGASNGTMVTIILEPTDTVTGTVITENNWRANKTVTLMFTHSKTTESDIQYSSIIIGAR